MPKLEVPTFLESPEPVWVRCESFKSLPSEEIACEIQRVSGENGLVITTANFFENNGSGARVWGLHIASVSNGNGKLVDFPSGERIAVPADKVDVPHGSPV